MARARHAPQDTGYDRLLEARARYAPGGPALPDALLMCWYVEDAIKRAYVDLVTLLEVRRARTRAGPDGACACAAAVE